VSHLLESDTKYLLSPAPDGVELRRGNTLLLGSLETEGRVEIKAEQIMLELGRLAQGGEELLAGLENHVRRRFRHRAAPRHEKDLVRAGLPQCRNEAYSGPPEPEGPTTRGERCVIG
jgi:hypothetical protein